MERRHRFPNRMAAARFVVHRRFSFFNLLHWCQLHLQLLQSHIRAGPVHAGMSDDWMVQNSGECVALEPNIMHIGTVHNKPTSRANQRRPRRGPCFDLVFKELPPGWTVQVRPSFRSLVALCRRQPSAAPLAARLARQVSACLGQRRALGRAHTALHAAGVPRRANTMYY